MDRMVVCDDGDNIRINLRGQGFAIGAPAKLVVELLQNLDDTKRLEELKIENDRLREALKRARELARKDCLSMREFAREIGVTPTQLSAWTDEIPNKEPDFKD